jgi:hypothetical protein
MPAPDPFRVATVLLALFVLLLAAGSASAYIGPGAGLDFIPYALTLLAFGLTAFSAILLWPVHALLRWIRGKKNKSAPPTATETVPEEARATSPTDP